MDEKCWRADEDDRAFRVRARRRFRVAALHGTSCALLLLLHLFVYVIHPRLRSAFRS